MSVCIVNLISSCSMRFMFLLDFLQVLQIIKRLLYSGSESVTECSVQLCNVPLLPHTTGFMPSSFNPIRASRKNPHIFIYRPIADEVEIISVIDVNE